MKLNEKAFTVIEMIVVLSMIGLLVVIFSPNFTIYTEPGNRKKAIDATRDLWYLTEMYEIENDRYPTKTPEVELMSIGDGESESSFEIETFYMAIEEGKVASIEGVLPQQSYLDVELTELDISEFGNTEMDEYEHFLRDENGKYYIISKKPLEKIEKNTQIPQ